MAPSIHCAILLLGCTSWLAAALPVSGRTLLQADADIVAQDQFEPVFQLVSNNSHPYSPQASVSILVTSLEMDTDASFANQWRAGREQTWQTGNTRWNLTVQFADTAAAGTYSAALHAAPCPSVFTADSLYKPPGNNSLDLQANLVASNGSGNFSITYPFLIDYDRVESVVIYNGYQIVGSNYIACADMIPPPPDFPGDWSALIEANFPDRGLTFPFRQLYSQSLNMARLDMTSYATDRIMLANFSAGNATFISPQNATYPHGLCNYSSIPPFLNSWTDASNASLLETSQLLRFDYSKVEYSPGHEVIRGITCEKWISSDSFDGPNGSVSYNASFYFPVNQWQVGRQDYHRLLKEIRVSGTTDDGDSFEAFFEYVNFKPQNFSNNRAAFDVCALAPRGVNCGCTKEQIAALNGLELNNDVDSVTIDNSTSQDSSGNCRLDSGVPHGFISQQAGPYVGLVIIGMVAGALFSFLGTWLYYRKFVGVGARDRVGHARFSGDFGDVK